MFRNNFYAVTCKCGHTGKARSYTPVTFAVMASNPYQAEVIARNIPRVKHGSPTAVISLKPISHRRFLEVIRKNKLNLFLQCRSMEEQKEKGAEIRIEREAEALPVKGNSRLAHYRSGAHCRGKDIIRNFKTYQRMNPVDCEEEWYE